MGVIIPNFWQDDGTNLKPKVSTRNIQSTTGVIKSGVLKIAPSLSSEKLLNVGLETWSNSTTLTNFAAGDIGGAGDGTLTQESGAGNVHSGTYSAKLTCGTGDVSHYFVQGIAVTETSFRVSYWCKNGTGQSIVVLVDADPAGGPGAKGYNFTGAFAGTWTVLAGGPTMDMVTQTNAAAYTQVVLDNIPNSDTGNIFAIFISPGTGGQTCYYDDVSLKGYTVTPVTLFNNTNVEDKTNLVTGAGDKVESLNSTGGAGFNYRKLTPDGAYTTDYSTFNFVSKPVEVATPTSSTHALNWANGYGKTPTITNINLKTIAQTTLYTVPSGKTFYPLFARLEITAIDTVTIPPVLGIGKSAGYNEFFASYTLEAMTSAGSYIFVDGPDVGVNAHVKFIAGDVIKLDITTGATATTLTASVCLVGILE